MAANSTPPTGSSGAAQYDGHFRQAYRKAVPKPTCSSAASWTAAMRQMAAPKKAHTAIASSPHKNKHTAALGGTCENPVSEIPAAAGCVRFAHGM